MNTVGTPLLWGGFAVVVAIMLAIDLLLQGRRGAHAMTMKQAAAWSLVWVTLSLLFNAAFWWYLVQTEGRAVADPQALAFLTGYLIEKSLAVDNVFVWLMLFSYFSVPAALQRRVLVYGVLGAIVLRTIMIFTGSWLISQFDWILYIFGAFLLFTGVKMALGSDIRPLKDAGLLEMGLWAKDGATPWQVLLAATKHAAMVCEAADDLGTVEVGKLADLIVVGANPLENVDHVRQLRLVFKEGRVVSDKRH